MIVMTEYDEDTLEIDVAGIHGEAFKYFKVDRPTLSNFVMKFCNSLLIVFHRKF